MIKNSPTYLEMFQSERIKALEQEVTRLNAELITARRELMETSLRTDQAALKIKVSNPDFLSPIKDLEFEIIEPKND